MNINEYPKGDEEDRCKRNVKELRTLLYANAVPERDLVDGNAGNKRANHRGQFKKAGNECIDKCNAKPE